MNVASSSTPVSRAPPTSNGDTLGYETPGYRNYMRDRIVEGGTADGDRRERAARVHMASLLDGGEVPADLRGAVEVLQAQNQYAMTCHESRGMASTAATDTAQRERDRLIKRHLESNGGDLDKALESTARDLRRGPATGRTGFTRESNRRTTVRESMTATRATTSTVLVKIIDEGQGSSGYYPAHVLEAAAREKVFPKGTLMLVDHPTVAEDMGRPEGSVDRLPAISPKTPTSRTAPSTRPRRLTPVGATSSTTWPTSSECPSAPQRISTTRASSSASSRTWLIASTSSPSPAAAAPSSDMPLNASAVQIARDSRAATVAITEDQALALAKAWVRAWDTLAPSSRQPSSNWPTTPKTRAW